MVETARPEPWRLRLPDSTCALRKRHDFARYLRTYGRATDDYVAAEVVFGEIVTNALLHAPGPIEIEVEWPEGQATIHVSDHGVPINLELEPAVPDPMAEHGRGMLIVRELAEAVSTVAYPGEGKTVSATLPVKARHTRS
jgi:anti-sigma regulatory factor (Ser/Thr protein kinase)